MLKTKNLNKLLSQNTSPLVTDIFILSPTGTLLAYTMNSTPAALRRQATLAASIWTSYTNLTTAHNLSTVLPPSPSSQSRSDSPTPTTTATATNAKSSSSASQPSSLSSASNPPTSIELETSTSHLSLRRLQSQLLLCLVGPTSVPPSSSTTTTSPSSDPTAANMTTTLNIKAGAKVNPNAPLLSPPSSLPSQGHSFPGSGSSMNGESGSTPTPSYSPPVQQQHHQELALSQSAASTSGQQIANASASTSVSGREGEKEGRERDKDHLRAVRAAALDQLRQQTKVLAEWLDVELEGFSLPAGA